MPLLLATLSLSLSNPHFLLARFSAQFRVRFVVFAAATEESSALVQLSATLTETRLFDLSVALEKTSAILLVAVVAVAAIVSVIV